MEILTGQTAGTLDADGTFPSGTINGRVGARLSEFAAKRRKQSGRGDPEGGK
jgi:hypothetical protein